MYITYIVIMFAMIFVLKYFAVFQNVLGMKFRNNIKHRIINREEVPDYINETYSQFEEGLAKLGFEYIGVGEVSDKLVGIDKKEYVYIYGNEDKTIFAELTLALIPSEYKPVEISFHSNLNTGKKILTFFCYEEFFVSKIPSLDAEDSMAMTLEEHLQYHKKRISEIKTEEFKVFNNENLLEELVETVNKSYKESLEIGVDEKVLTYDKENNLQFSIKSSLKVVGKLFKAHKKYVKLLKAYMDVGFKYKLPNEIHIEKYFEEKQALEQIDKRFDAKMILFAVSFIIFLVGSIFYFTPVAGITVSLAILFHEAGHMFCMKLFGYKNLKMVFIPLVGGVASGTNKNVKANHDVISLFAGPVPGIIVGAVLVYLAIFVFKGNKILIEVASYVLLINYFNLLPLLPFDGGQIVNKAIFVKNRILGYLFYILSIGGLVAVYIYLKSEVLLFIIPLIIIGLISQIRIENLAKKVRALSSEEKISEKGIIENIYQIFTNEKKSVAPEKVKSLTASVDMILNADKLSLRASIITILIYLFLMAIPIAVYFNFYSLISINSSLTKNANERFKEHLKQAESGNSKYFVRVGNDYKYGDGTKEDNQKAMEWYQKAADAKIGEGYYSLGRMYEYGHGVEVNIPKTIELYKLAYENGYKWISGNIGDIYRTDLKYGSIDEAIKWYKIGAESGEAYSQGFLADCYFNRNNGEDRIMAYVWYTIYNKNENKDEDDEAEGDIALHDSNLIILKTSLSKTDLQKGDKMVEEMENKNVKTIN